MRLMTYMDKGGNLFLSSQDFLLDNDPNTFITDYLHIAGHEDEAIVTSVAGMSEDTISDGMAFTLSYPFYNFSDYIVPGTGAVGIFYETQKASSVSNRSTHSIHAGEGVQVEQPSSVAGKASLFDYSALRYPASGQSTYKVVFFSFPFEAVPQAGSYPNNSYTLMRRIMGWFGLEKPEYIRGDANGDQVINLADVLYLVAYLYKNGPAPNPFEAGDVDCSGGIDLNDVLYLVNYLYKNGPAPGCD